MMQSQPIPTGPWPAQISAAAWWALALGGLGWLFESYDSFMLSLTLPALTAEFGQSRAEAGALLSITPAGQICGGIAFGFVSDKLGRVRTAFLCILTYSVFSGLVGFVPSARWLGVLRFCGALGMSGTWTAGAALVAETWGPQHRGRGGAFMQMGLPCSAIVAICASGIVGAVSGGLEHGGWRTLYFIGALPAVILFFVARRTPQSPVWLARRHSKDASIHARQRRVETAAPRGMAQRGAGLRLHLLFALCFLGRVQLDADFPGHREAFRFPPQLPFVLSLQLGAMSGFLVFAALVDRLGRRPMFMAYICIGIVAVSAYVFGPAPTLIVTIFFTGFSVNGIFAGMRPFIAELTPDTSSRGLIMGMLYNGGRIGGFLAPSVIGLLASGSGGREAGLGTMIGAFMLALLVILLMPETKGRVLQ